MAASESFYIVPGNSHPLTDLRVEDAVNKEPIAGIYNDYGKWSNSNGNEPMNLRDFQAVVTDLCNSVFFLVP
jgi:hypothetical protein